MTVWQQSTEIFESLVDYSQEQALYKLKLLNDVSKEVKQRVSKLIIAVHKENKVLDAVNSGNLFQQLKSITDLTGKTLGNYKISELIAIGGMSYIYKAHRIDSIVQKPVAIKVMTLNKSPQAIALFNREQQTLSKLNHPNIVSFLHGGQTEDGIYYFVMEYVEAGIPIDTYIKNKNINNAAIICKIKFVANTMKFAHENLIIHGDLKADNILIDKNENIKIVDFGISAFTYKPKTDGINAYTPDIASPEQIRGEKLTTKTDVFSLAATLLQLLIKDSKLPDFKPESYDEKQDEKYVSEILNESHLDTDLCNILIKALRTDSFKRYFTMFDFAKDLHKWALKKPVSATKITRFYLFKKFFSRHKLLVITSSILTTLVLVLMYSTYSYIRDIKHESIQAQKQIELIQKQLK